MKILFVSDNFPPAALTGPSVVALNLAKRLIGLGHDLAVVTTVQDAAEAGVSDYQGIRIYRIYTRYPYRINNYLSLFNPQVVFKFKKIIKGIMPDVCHFHNVHGYVSYHCFKVGYLYSRSVFLTAHDMMLINYGKMHPKNGTCRYRVSFLDNLKAAKKRYNPFRNILIRHYLKYVDKIFCITDIQREILALNGITNTTTIHNAMDVDYWQKNEMEIAAFKDKYGLAGKKVIMFGGRLSEAKGGVVILKAMERVAREINNAVLLVVGEKTDYAQYLMDEVKDADLSEHVVFTGWLGRDDMGLAFYSADVCVTPSIYFDPFNLFNIEAMSAGNPVVGTRYGGTPEIVIDGKTGHIVDPLKIAELSGAIIDLLKHPDKAEELGRAGRIRVAKDFSLNRQVEQTLEWYGKFTD